MPDFTHCYPCELKALCRKLKFCCLKKDKPVTLMERVIALIAEHGKATVDELAEHITDRSKEQISSAVKNCVRAGLVHMAERAPSVRGWRGAGIYAAGPRPPGMSVTHQRVNNVTTREVLAYVTDNPNVRRSQIAAALGLDSTLVGNILFNLSQQGRIFTNGQPPRSTWSAKERPRRYASVFQFGAGIGV